MSTAAPDPGVSREQVDLREPDVSQLGVGEIVGRVTADFSTLVRSEIQLARTEITQEARDAGKAAGAFSGAVVAAWMTLLFLSMALMWTLNSVMPLGWAALIVAVIWAIVAAITYAMGKSRLRRVGPPRETVESIKEDVRWVQQRRSE